MKRGGGDECCRGIMPGALSEGDFWSLISNGPGKGDLLFVVVVTLIKWRRMDRESDRNIISSRSQ